MAPKTREEWQELFNPPGFAVVDGQRRFIYSDEQRAAIAASTETKLTEADYTSLEISMTRAAEIAFFHKKYALGRSKYERYQEISGAAETLYRLLKGTPISILPFLYEEIPVSGPSSPMPISDKEPSYDLLLANLRWLWGQSATRVDQFNMQNQPKNAEDPITDYATELAVEAYESLTGKSTPLSGGNPNGPVVRFVRAVAGPMLIAMGLDGGEVSGEAWRSRISTVATRRSKPWDEGDVLE